jgi:hypothetical protein
MSLGDIDVLLTDDFSSFASKIKSIHDHKKEKTAELKAIYEKHKQEMAALDAEAQKLYSEWQASINKTPKKEADSK